MKSELTRLEILDKIVGSIIMVSALFFIFMADYISSLTHLGINSASMGISFYILPLVFIVLGFFVYKGTAWAERASVILFVLIVLILVYLAVLFLVLIILPIAAILLIIVPLLVIISQKLKLDKVKKIIKKKIIKQKSNFLRTVLNFSA
jgi:hypothetical protein